MRQHLKVEKTAGDRTEGSEAVVEVAAMEEATVAELEAVNRWAVLGVDMEVEVNKVFYRNLCLKRCFFSGHGMGFGGGSAWGGGASPGQFHGSLIFPMQNCFNDRI